jgi:RND family efflux transporter MFP subunit
MDDGRNPTAATRARPAATAGDLARLRIPRGQAIRGYRGFPFLRVAAVLIVAGALFLFREPLLRLVSGGAAEGLEVGRAVRVGPGQAQEGDVAANGYVVADRTTSVATVLSGRLVELHAQEGDVVPENFVVGRIQHDDLEAQETAAGQRVKVAAARVAEAQASLEAARMDLARLAAEKESEESLVAEARERADRLARDVERNRALFEKKWIQADEWDRIQADARAARNAVEAAEARVAATAASSTAWSGEIARRAAALDVARAEEAEAQVALRQAAIEVEKTKIRAPFEGLVVRKDAEVGEIVAPTGAGGRGSVFTIVDPTSFEVQVDLSERRIAKVAEEDRATIFLDADPDTGHPGRVRKIWPRADKSKGTIEVRVTFDERPKGLRPEMAARVVFRGQREAVPQEAHVTVPARAVAGEGADAHVFVVEGGRAARRPVVLGERRGTTFVVAKGLAGGEEVVLDPPASLRDGDAVRRKEAR